MGTCLEIKLCHVLKLCACFCYTFGPSSSQPGKATGHYALLRVKGIDSQCRVSNSHVVLHTAREQQGRRGCQVLPAQGVLVVGMCSMACFLVSAHCVQIWSLLACCFGMWVCARQQAPALIGPAPVTGPGQATPHISAHQRT
jgi:hypothetical protein